MPDLTESQRRPWHQRIELLLVFLAGFALLSHIYAWDLNTPMTEIGAPGNDSFYHTRMAGLFPEHGLLHEFPWLRWTWFTQDDNRFVSHHYGFHMLLLPFTRAATLLGYDELTGGRWFMCTMLGLQLALLDAILISAGVRFRILWLALILLWPHQFFERQAFVRAIGPTTVGLLTLTWLMLNRRYVIMIFAIAAFLHLYLGAVLYVPVLIGALVAAEVLHARRWRELPWALTGCGLLGWALGIATHPYQTGMFEFLQMQVFGTGLSPDIEVGREWRPYNDVWWFAGYLAGPLLLALTAAVLLRLRYGPRLEPRTLAIVLIQTGFLLLMFKARRFVEFWPPFALLAAAMLAGPPLERLGHRFARRPTWQRALLLATGWALGLAMAAALLLKWGRLPMMPHATWLAIAVVLLSIIPLLQIDTRRRGLYVQGALAGGLLLTVATGLAAPRLEEARGSTRCRYDLATLNEMMAYLRENTPRDAIVFTDDWDVFPVYFYHNTHNRFVVGLDPKFTHERRPDLWDRYVRITRGQVPATMRTQLVTATGRQEHDIDIALSDIRTHFQAEYVIVDDDHDRLADLLDGAWNLAEPFWPRDPDDFRRADYRVYRIRAAEEAIPPRPRPTVPTAVVYLDDLPLRPVAGTDVFIGTRPDGSELEASGRRHLHGFSIRGQGSIEVTPPEGVWRMQATLALAVAEDGPCIARVFGDGKLLLREEVTDEARTIDVTIGTPEVLTIETIGPSGAVFQAASPLLIRAVELAGN